MGEMRPGTLCIGIGAISNTMYGRPMLVLCASKMWQPKHDVRLPTVLLSGGYVHTFDGTNARTGQAACGSETCWEFVPACAASKAHE